MKLEPWQVAQFRLIGSLIRGDWSGSCFDGRDVKHWIEQTLAGENIMTELRGLEESYR